MALPRKGIAAITGIGLAITLVGCSAGAESSEYTTREVSDGKTDFIVVENPNGGATLSYAADGPIELIEVQDGGAKLAFKDTNGSGELDAWEDWRLDPKERAAALAETMTAEQISGLMLFSAHEGSPGDGLTDAQKTYLSKDNLRAVLNAGNSDVKDNVTWVNEMQAYVETLAESGTPYIPANFSSDPRNSATEDDPGAVGTISKWPSNLGLAATFSPETAEQFGRVISAEYRALGLTNALSPQIDLATEPRWLRVYDSLGENSELASRLAEALVTGYQSTYSDDGKNTGWGLESVPTMIKHAPGDGSAEGGRESHTEAGKYAVPGDNLTASLDVFAAAGNSLGMMTNYSIMLDAEGNAIGGGDKVGTAYNPDIMAMIREDLAYDGVIVTDWAVMDAKGESFIPGMGMAWGAESMPNAERYFTVLRNGVDMFGGVNDATYILEAVDLWNAAFEAGDVDIDADTRWQQSGARILTGFFAPGLYDSPFVDLDASVKIVGSEEAVTAGYEAQLNSVVLTKNDGFVAESTVEDWADKTVYIPHTVDTGHDSLFGPAQVTDKDTISVEAAEELFAKVVTDEVTLDADGKVTEIVTPDLTGVDLALVGMNSPSGGAIFGNSGRDAETGEIYPLSLQWAPYTADGDNVRRTSIGGDTLADGTTENRSYFGNTSRISNEADLDAFNRTVAAVEAAGGDIPILTLLRAKNPVVPTEIEAGSSAIVVGFGASDKALLEVVLGLHEAQGRLPIGFPASMDAVEAQQEGVAEDMETYVDAAGNDWKFGFGLNFAGVIAK